MVRGRSTHREPPMSAVIACAAGAPLPLLQAQDPGRTVAFDGGRRIDAAAFLADVAAAAAVLPPNLLAINLCEDRYAFLVAFAALAASGRASLLPQSRAPAVVAELLARYPEACCVAEQVPAEAPERLHLLRPAAGPGDAPCPLLPPEAPVAIGFTSGSTGQPCGHA